MSINGNVRTTALWFAIENGVSQDKAVAFLNEITDDLGGDAKAHDFSGWVAEEYARYQNSRVHQPLLCAYTNCNNEARHILCDKHYDASQ